MIERIRIAMLVAALAAGPVAAQGRGGGPMADAFAGMSPEGRRIMSSAMLENRADPARDAVRTAHERVLKILEADPLDRRALAEAMKAEDAAFVAHLDQRRERMLEAFGALSAADRRAYAAANRSMQGPGARGGRGGMARNF